MSTNHSERINTEEQPVRYYQYPKDAPAEGDASRFDKLRTAQPANAAAPTANTDDNVYNYDLNQQARTPETLPPPHHDLNAISSEDRAAWQRANGNPNYDGQPQAFQKDSSLATTNSGSSKSGSGLKKQDSATHIGGMKSDDYLQNISHDGSGVIASMHLNRASPKGTTSTKTPPILIQKDYSSSQQKSSEFANLKPQRDGVDHTGLGVVTDSSEVKNTEGQAKSREWTYDTNNGDKRLDPQAANSAAIPNANSDNSNVVNDKGFGSNAEMSHNDKVKDPQAINAAAIPNANSDNSNFKKDNTFGTHEKIHSGDNNDKEFDIQGKNAAAIPNANSNNSNFAHGTASNDGKKLDPQAANPAAIPKANAHDADLKEQHSLLHSNKSGDHHRVTPNDGGVSHPNSKSNIEKPSVWQKITCHGGSKTKPGKHYVNPAGVVNNNQGLK